LLIAGFGKIINFGDSQIFENATTYTCLLFLSRLPSNSLEYYEFKAGKAVDLLEPVQRGQQDPRIVNAKINSNLLMSTSWNFGSQDEIALRSRLSKLGERLENIAQKIFQGLVTSADPIYILEELEKPKNGLVKVFSKETHHEYILETEILKPLLKGADIKRYAIKPNKYRILFPYEIQNGKSSFIYEEKFTTKYKKTWQYLKENEEKLRRREHGKMDHDKWYAYVYPKNLEEFDKPKILIQVLANRATMTVDLEGKYYFVGGGNAGGYGLTLKPQYELDLRYILALLNSTLLDRLLKSISTQFRGGYYSYAKRFIEQLPIVIADDNSQNKIVSLVDKILTSREETTRWKLERELEDIIFEIYALTKSEIELIGGTETDRLSERLKSKYGAKQF